MGFFYFACNSNTMRNTIVTIAALALITMAGCRKDEEKLEPTCDGSNPTYNGQVKSILDSRCASGNCHPNFDNYDGLSSALQSGAFKREVLIRQTMPEGSPLTQQQLNTIQCWVDNGFPEN